MSLRLRLSLFYTLLVTLILAAAALALDLGLRRVLQSGVDESLAQTLGAVRSTLVHETTEGHNYRLDEEQLSSLPPEATIALTDATGKVLYTTRNLSTAFPLELGYITEEGWRVYTEKLGDYYLMAVRSLKGIQQNINDFHGLLLWVFPLALGLSLVLGYLLAGRALAPAARITRVAYTLAQSSNFSSRLPESEPKDELWQVAKAFNTLLAAQEQALAREQRFTQDAAHELRTPLTVLRGRLERAIETGDQGQLQKALAASDDLLELVAKLLDLARVESGQGYSLTSIALDELALEASEDCQPNFSQAGLSLELQLPAKAIPVMADPLMLRLAIRNLLINASKFAQSKVQLRVWYHDAEAHLEVQDNGPGVSPNALPHLFERFYQAEASHRHLGSGLGLALVKSVVERHGGQTYAHNRPEGGAVVGFVLPL